MREFLLCNAWGVSGMGGSRGQEGRWAVFPGLSQRLGSSPRRGEWERHLGGRVPKNGPVSTLLHPSTLHLGVWFHEERTGVTKHWFGDG